MKKLVADIGDVELMLDINRQTILKHRSGIRICPRLVGMPEPFETRPRLLWWLADLEAWIESKRTFRFFGNPETLPIAPEIADFLAPAKRKAGRPPNKLKFQGAK